MNLVEMDDLIDRELTSLPGWCTYPKAKRLVRIAAASGMTGLDQAVELGVYGGRSLVALALGFRLAGKGIVDGIDSYAAADCLEGEQTDVDKKLWGQDTDYEDLFRRATEGLTRFGVEGYSRVIRKRCDEAASDYANGSLGLIHVDGNHSELVSCRDVQTWLPKMRAKATWIADDTNWPSMRRAIGMLKAAGFTLSETGSEGYWSVFIRGH